MSLICNKLPQVIMYYLRTSVLDTRSKYNLIHEQNVDPLLEKFYGNAERIKFSAKKPVPKAKKIPKN